MQKIPTTLEDAAEWPLRADALRLESPVAYKHLLSRVVKYVHEVMPSDEEAIANEVRLPVCVLLYSNLLGFSRLPHTLLIVYMQCLSLLELAEHLEPLGFSTCYKRL